MSSWLTRVTAEGIAETLWLNLEALPIDTSISFDSFINCSSGSSVRSWSV